jgi:signal transduction histidine kinase/CheY-like chemotaxis protein
MVDPGGAAGTSAGAATTDAGVIAVLAEVSRILAASADAVAALPDVVRLAVPALADLCAVDLVDRAGAVRRVAVHAEPVLRGVAPEELARPAELPAGGKPAQVRALPGGGARIAVALEARGQVLGGLTLATAGRPATPADVAAAGDLAWRIAAAVDTARLIAEAARRQREADVLSQVVRSINASLDPGTVLQSVADGARELCGSDLSAIALREEGTGAVVFRHRAGTRYRAEERLVVQPGRGAGGLALASGRPVRSAALADDPRFAQDAEYMAAVAAERITAVMVVPIAIEGRVEGLLYVDNRAPRPFTDRDEAVLLHLAEHAAVAIRNTQLLAREQRARADAETANHSKDEFLATLSHELRTPLNAILGWAVTLRTARLDERLSTRAVEVIERNARALGQLIEDLLDVSRIVTGKLRLDVRLVDLVTVTEAALDAVRPAADAKGIRLQTVLDPRAGPVSGDPDRLQQVVWNLLSNAIKFTPKGGRVHVRLQRVDSHIEIVVSDTGRGVAPELLPYVFDRFRQDSASARHGLGIGLALVRHLVELHGGTATAESPGPDQGATFTVRLPLLVHPEPSGDDERLHPTAFRGAAFTPTVSLAGVRLLVVDDERDTLDLFASVLRMTGAEVRGASGVEEALGVFEAWQPHLLISDIGMPGEDGYGLIRRVRALAPERGGRVPAVAVTAYGSVDDRIRILSAGFQMHVPKPVEPAELVAVVANLVNRLEVGG